MIEVLVGNIASGKSTYCRDRAKDGAIIINDDAIVNALHCDQYGLYSEELKPLYKAIETQILMTSIAMGLDVVVDRGLNLRPDSRRRWVSLANSMDERCEAVIFEFYDPAVHATRRMQHDARGHDFNYWLDVATRFHRQYEKPTLAEGFRTVVDAHLEI
jgi:predicted kinase